MNYTIGIVTYIKRFEKYFKPLIEDIKKYKPNVELIVCINGEHKTDFNQEYRKNILEFIATYNNVYPVMHPEFRSLSKLWNTCLINSTNNKILLLNDDVTISNFSFFESLERYIKYENNCFKINGSWSHVVLNRDIVNEVGWFDERFLAVGEEDGDFEWRFQNKLGSPFLSYHIPGIINHVEHENCLNNIKKVNKKYSEFNKKVSDLKYKEDIQGKNYGIMGRSLVCVSETKEQYPNEKFYWDNKDKL